MTRASKRTLDTGLWIFAFGSAPTLPLSCPWGRPLTSWPFHSLVLKSVRASRGRGTGSVLGTQQDLLGVSCFRSYSVLDSWSQCCRCFYYFCHFTNEELRLKEVKRLTATELVCGPNSSALEWLSFPFLNGTGKNQRPPTHE